MSCSVKGCGNYFRKTKLLNGNSIKYFSFPKDFTIVTKWLAACGNQNVNIKKGMICSQHFDASYFIQPSKEKSLFYSQKRLTKLRADAIPTLHLTFDTSQVEATHVDKRPLPLIDTSDTLESTCNGTLTSESKCNDTVLPDTFSDDIPVSQEIQLIHNTPILSTSKDVTVLSEKL
ncbi:hypothetical protein ALC57_01514 [Trachymyrmex cornetzi]|uniref:THAP-type domain-containing protein n=1 Tax=Trachymyrmex cornetzi TaxID=471704 RepID=A0A151JQ42_9HYME|nr:hypothetical protein ALC57_01514 [Trachymyrmex cornetzi]